MTVLLKCLRVCLISGFFILAASLLPRCSKDYSPSAPDGSGGLTESATMKQLSENLIVALKAEDKTKVLDLVAPEYKTILADELNASSASMAAFGSAMEKRTLVSASALYAEYEVVVQGQTYEIAFGQCGDGKWQLVRF